MFQFVDDGNKNVLNSNFIELWKSKWDKLHEETSVFKYKIDKLLERVVDGDYLLQLNTDRGSKRRTPEQIDDICQPFDAKKFNFNKVVPSEILYGIKKNNDERKHVLIVNVSPINRYHTLLCPSVTECLPQIITMDSISLALELMFLARNRDLRIGFNSLCAMASVNHLHYHLFLEPHNLPVESARCKKLKGPLYFLEDHPAQAFCFEANQGSVEETSSNIFKLVTHFIDNSIAHNVMITRGSYVTKYVTKRSVKTVTEIGEVTKATESGETKTFSVTESSETAVTESVEKKRSTIFESSETAVTESDEMDKVTDSSEKKTLTVNDNSDTSGTAGGEKNTVTVAESSATAVTESGPINNETKAGVSNATGYDKECIRVLVWPRKSSAGIKQLNNFNIAVCEFSGWFPVFDQDAFNNLTAKDLARELKKWNIDNFDELCEHVKFLF